MLENRHISIKKSADVIFRFGNAAISSYPQHPQNAQAAFIALQPFTLPGDYLLSVELFKILENDEYDELVLPQIIQAYRGISQDSEDFLAHTAGLLILKQAIDQVAPKTGQKLDQENQDLFAKAREAFLKNPLPNRRFATVYPRRRPKVKPTLESLERQLEAPIANPDAFFTALEDYVTTHVPKNTEKSSSLLTESFGGQHQFNAFYKKLLSLAIHAKASSEAVKNCLSLILEKLQVSDYKAVTSNSLFLTLNTLISAKKFELAFAILELVPPFNYSPFGNECYEANLFFKQLHQYLMENNHEESCLFALKTYNWFLKNPGRHGTFKRLASTQQEHSFLHTLVHFQPVNSVIAAELALLFEQLYQIPEPSIKAAFANHFTVLQKKADATKNTATHLLDGWLVLKILLGLSIFAGVVFIGLASIAIGFPDQLVVSLNFFLDHLEAGVYFFCSSLAIAFATWIFEQTTGFFANQKKLAEQTLNFNKPENYVSKLSAVTNIHVDAWYKAYQIKTDTYEDLKSAFELYPVTKKQLNPANDLDLFASYFQNEMAFADLQFLIGDNQQLLTFLMHDETNLQHFIKEVLFPYFDIDFSNTKSDLFDVDFKRALLDTITTKTQNLTLLLENCTSHERIELILKNSNPITSKRILDFIFNDQITFEKFFNFKKFKKLQKFINFIKQRSGLSTAELDVYLNKLSPWIIQNQQKFEAFLSMGESNHRLQFLLENFPQQKDQITKLFVSLPLDEMAALIKTDVQWERALTKPFARIYLNNIYHRPSLKNFFPEYINLFRGLKLIIPEALTSEEWDNELQLFRESFACDSKNNHQTDTFILNILLSSFTHYPPTSAPSRELYVWLQEEQAVLNSRASAIPAVFSQESPSQGDQKPSDQKSSSLTLLQTVK